MALYELRTYSLYVGKLAEARELYQSDTHAKKSALSADKRLRCC